MKYFMPLREMETLYGSVIQATLMLEEIGESSEKQKQLIL